MGKKRTSGNTPSKITVPDHLRDLEQELQRGNPEIFNGVAVSKRIEILESLSYTFLSIQEKSHSGPLPAPETVSEYDTIIPNGAERIMKMAENQQNHRITMENKIVSSQTSLNNKGQIFGLVIGLAGIGCGTFLAAIGQGTVGGIIASGTVVSLVSVFVIGKISQKED